MKRYNYTTTKYEVLIIWIDPDGYEDHDESVASYEDYETAKAKLEKLAKKLKDYPCQLTIRERSVKRCLYM